MRRALLLAVLLVSCRKPAPAPAGEAQPAQPGALVAVVENADGLVLQRQPSGGAWARDRVLPREARSLRFSPDGRSVAWLVDDVTGPEPVVRGFHLAAGASQPTPLGPVAVRRVEGGGLAVGRDGAFAHLDGSGTLILQPKSLRLGRGAWPLFGDGNELLWVSQEGGAGHGRRCLAAYGAPGRALACGEAIQPLASKHGALVWRDNLGLRVRRSGPGEMQTVLGEVLDADVDSSLRLLAVLRQQTGSSYQESIRIGDRDLLSAPLVLSAKWDVDGTVLAIRADERGMQTRMLAHAPEEFGGEAAAGRAVRVSLEGTATDMPGLEGAKVRALFRAY